MNKQKKRTTFVWPIITLRIINGYKSSEAIQKHNQKENKVNENQADILERETRQNGAKKLQWIERKKDPLSSKVVADVE